MERSPYKIILIIVIAGLITSVIALFGYEFARDMDPVLIFLLVTYPILIGTTVHYYLLQKRIYGTLQEEHYARWYMQGFAKACLTETDPQLIREELTDSILRLIKPALVNVYELDSDGRRLEVTRQAGIKDLPDSAREGYLVSEGIPGWVMENQNPVILPDLSTERHHQIDPWAKAMGLRSYAAVPIVVSGETVGIITMYSLEPDFFHDSNLLSAQIVAQLYSLRLAAVTPY